MSSLSTSSPRILIAEDNQIIGSQLMSLIGNGSTQLTDQADLIDKKMNLPEDEYPNIIIANIQLADRKIDSGFIKKIRRKRTIPMVILTGYPRKMLSKEMLDLPEIYFLQKPFLSFQLTAVLQNALNPNT